MRSVLLGLIFLCEIIIYLTRNVDINEESLRFMTTLVLVVLAAFTISAILRNFKSIHMPRNYTISGILGVIAGIVYYSWVGQHLHALTDWLANYGLLILLILIFVSALILYLSKPSSNEPKSAKVQSAVETRSESTVADSGSESN